MRQQGFVDRINQVGALLVGHRAHAGDGNKGQEQQVSDEDRCADDGLEFPRSADQQEGGQGRYCDGLESAAQFDQAWRAETDRLAHSPQQHQDGKSPDCVKQHLLMSLGQGPLRIGKWYGDPNHQHERGPDAVVEAQPFPGAVVQLVDHCIGEPAMAQSLEPEGNRPSADDPEHDETAECVQRNQAGCRGLWNGRCLGGGQHSRGLTCFHRNLHWSLEVIHLKDSKTRSDSVLPFINTATNLGREKTPTHAVARWLCQRAKIDGTL